VKLLGVHIDRELYFNGHVTTICRKAGHQLNALERHLANVLSIDDNNILFDCFILSHLDFTPAMWHCCSLADIKQLKVFRSKLFTIFIMTTWYLSSYVELREKVINHYCMFTELS